MNKNSFSIIFINFLILFISLTQSAKLKTKLGKKYSQFLHKMEQSGEIEKNRDESYLESHSSAAIRYLIEGLPALNNDTSCKVAAKYCLYTIGNIENEEDRHLLPLTNKTEEDLSNIKQLLQNGYILQIEIKPNHHFVVFLESGDQLYLLQAFQDLFRLRDWILDPYSSKPMTLDKFISLLRSALNPLNTKEEFITTLLQLFLPHSMWTNFEKVKGLATWFRFMDYVTFVKIDYVKYNFENNPEKDKKFVQGFNYVDHNFLI